MALRQLIHSGLGSGASLLGSLSSSLSMPARGTVRRIVKGRSPRLKMQNARVNPTVVTILQTIFTGGQFQGLPAAFIEMWRRREPRFPSSYLSLFLREVTSRFMASADSVASSSSLCSFLRLALALWASSSASSS